MGFEGEEMTRDEGRERKGRGDGDKPDPETDIATPRFARSFKELLGGYATGTLTSAEREALLHAALDDQDLFDELAREQSLKELGFSRSQEPLERRAGPETR